MMKNNFFFALLLLLLAGCSGNVGLKGKVVFSDDQSPVPTGTVFFEKGGYLARAVIQPNGTFTVGSVKSKDGLPPGTYGVYITSAHQVVGKCELGIDIYGTLIDEKYTKSSTSDISIDVTASTKYVEFIVDRYKPTARR